MSQDFVEGALTFSFPDAWSICRPQGSFFYSRNFQNFCGGCKEMDFVAYDPARGTLWLIEVKDYSSHPRTKLIDMADEVAVKTRDVLAMLPVAGFNDQTPSNADGLQAGDFWRAALTASSLRIVLHCELLPRASPLFPSEQHAANLQAKLKQKLRAVALNPLFTNRRLGRALPWAVTRTD